MARPKKKQECLSTVISFALSPTEAKQIYSFAYHERISVSRWIRIRLGLDKSNVGRASERTPG